ncbi:uncharacterized protein F5147DRAFT_658545 [Suillus discolor]|uniref:Uncharacterized protein n=1 Tax=Suillus discolor TaxID=1912936 RepID=A0A9P7JMF0_9AGAM|nr:uncharacterized protein F5147DRAFT_658545 [Suillus discolor]KAG2088923.1 hypothetical protein F5147DRAFT_658545 [Suillus discolor]
MACAWTSLGKLTLKLSVAYASTFNYSQSVVLVEKRCLVPFPLVTVTVASKLFPFCVESATSNAMTEKFLRIACMSIECYESNGALTEANHHSFNGGKISMNHSCISVNSLSTWYYYFPVVLYDILMVTVLVSTMHLLRYKPLSSRCASLIILSVIYDGIEYFLVLSGNVERIAAHPLSYDRYRDSETQLYYIHSLPLLVGRDINRPYCNLDGSRSSRSPINTEFRPTSPRNSNDMKLDIPISVEHPVAVDYMDESRHLRSFTD